MWFDEISKDSDVVISTRVRFARNLEPYKFPHMLSSAEKDNVIAKIKESVDLEKYDFFKTEDIDELTLFSLVEKHLISKEFAAKGGGAIIINKKSNLVCMINEEDHMRIQTFRPGLNTKECYDELKEFTDEIEAKVKFAESEKYGYLTACPTNVGTAMRVSIMLHLPGLTKLGVISDILEQVRSLGLSVRGMYGENTSAYGNIYQISNQKTLGLSESEIMERVDVVVKTLINEERKARESINSTELEDEIYRAYGILKNSRILKEEECLKLLSKVRLGVSMKIIDDIDLAKVQRLMNDIHYNSLALILKKKFTGKDEDIERANYIRKELI